MSDIEQRTPQVSAESVIPAGKRPYFLAQIALMDMRKSMDYQHTFKTVQATNGAIREISRADDEGLFEPPLTEELSVAIKDAEAYGNQEGAYLSKHATLTNLDHAQLKEAALLVAAVVDHGLRER